MEGDNEARTVAAWVDADTSGEIEDYKDANDELSESEAIRSLLETGLKAEETGALAATDGGRPQERPDVVFLGMGVAGLSTIFAFLLSVAGNPELLGWTVMFGFTTALLALIYGSQWSITQAMDAWPSLHR